MGVNATAVGFQFYELVLGPSQIRVSWDPLDLTARSGFDISQYMGHTRPHAEPVEAS